MQLHGCIINCRLLLLWIAVFGNVNEILMISWNIYIRIVSFHV